MALGCGSSAAPESQAPQRLQGAARVAKLCKISISAWFVSRQDDHYDFFCLGGFFRPFSLVQPDLPGV